MDGEPSASRTEAQDQAAAADESIGPLPANYDGMSRLALIKLCRARGVDYSSAGKDPSLIRALLTDHDGGTAVVHTSPQEPPSLFEAALTAVTEQGSKQASLARCSIDDNRCAEIAAEILGVCEIELDLEANQISDATSIVQLLSGSTGLVALNLAFNRLTSVGIAAIGSALAASTTLRVLDLGRNSVGDSGAAAIAVALETNASLESLLLHKCDIADNGIESLATVLEQHNTTLRKIDVGANRFGSYAVECLADVLAAGDASKGHITSLSIRRADLRRADMIALANKMETNRSLAYLDLRSNKLADSGAEVLSRILEFPGCPLVEVDVCGNKITQKGIDALTAATEDNTTLKTLRLVAADEGDEAGTGAETVPQLHQFLLRNRCRVAEEEKASLLAASDQPVSSTAHTTAPPVDAREERPGNENTTIASEDGVDDVLSVLSPKSLDRPKADRAAPKSAKLPPRTGRGSSRGRSRGSSVSSPLPAAEVPVPDPSTTKESSPSSTVPPVSAVVTPWMTGPMGTFAEWEAVIGFGLCQLRIQRGADGGFGFSLTTHEKRGGSGGFTHFVSSVDEGGEAQRAGLLVGQQLCEVDGTPLSRLSHQAVLKLVAASSSPLIDVLLRSEVQKSSRQSSPVSPMSLTSPAPPKLLSSALQSPHYPRSGRGTSRGRGRGSSAGRNPCGTYGGDVRGIDGSDEIKQSKNTKSVHGTLQSSRTGRGPPDPAMTVGLHVSSHEDDRIKDRTRGDELQSMTAASSQYPNDGVAIPEGLRYGAVVSVPNQSEAHRHHAAMVSDMSSRGHDKAHSTVRPTVERAPIGSRGSGLFRDEGTPIERNQNQAAALRGAGHDSVAKKEEYAHNARASRDGVTAGSVRSNRLPFRDEGRPMRAGRSVVKAVTAKGTLSTPHLPSPLMHDTASASVRPRITRQGSTMNIDDEYSADSDIEL